MVRQNIQSELDSFSQFVQQKLREGRTANCLDEFFEVWRTEYPSPSDSEADRLAISASVDDFLRGERGRPSGELSAELRARIGAQ
jgi:hypothetical protein